MKAEQIKVVENINKTSDSCLNKNFKLINIEEKKYAETKKCLYKIDDVDDIDNIRKIEVFADKNICNKKCLKCRRYYDIEFKVFETTCKEELTYFKLCIGKLKNTSRENGKVKQNALIFTVVLTVLFLIVIGSILLCYHKFKRTNNRTMVSKKTLKYFIKIYKLQNC